MSFLTKKSYYYYFINASYIYWSSSLKKNVIGVVFDETTTCGKLFP